MLIDLDDVDDIVTVTHTIIFGTPSEIRLDPRNRSRHCFEAMVSVQTLFSDRDP